jgi:hypothetical protein
MEQERLPEAPIGHARWSRAVVGDPVASHVNAQKVKGSSAHKCLQTSRFLTPLAAGLAAATQWLPVDANALADCAHEKDLQMQVFS